MHVVAIIQARMGSARLPGKVLSKIGKETMLTRVLQRVNLAELVDKIIVATTLKPEDQAIVVEAEKIGVHIHRGSVEDVLDRYYRTAIAHQADVIVRITSDCPLIDPQLIDKHILAFLKERPDYASSVLKRTYPRGLDIEVMSMAALTRAWHEAGDFYQRVHVTPFIYQRPDIFRLLPVFQENDNSAHRWTVDTVEDLEFVRTVYDRLDSNGLFGWQEVLRLVEKEPDLTKINYHIKQKSLREG